MVDLEIQICFSMIQPSLNQSLQRVPVRSRVDVLVFRFFSRPWHISIDSCDRHHTINLEAFKCFECLFESFLRSFLSQKNACSQFCSHLKDTTQKKSHQKGDQKLMQMEGRSVDCPPVYGSVGQLQSSDGEKFTSLSTTFQQPWVWKQHNVDFLISSDIRFEKTCTHDIWYVLIRIYIYIHIFRDKTLLWIRDVDNSYIHIYDGRSRYLKCGQS